MADPASLYQYAGPAGDSLMHFLFPKKSFKMKLEDLYLQLRGL